MAIQVERLLVTGVDPQLGGLVQVQRPGQPNIPLATYLTAKEANGEEVVSVAVTHYPPNGTSLVLVLRVP